MDDQLFDRSRPHTAREALFGGSGVVRVWNLVARPEPPFAAVLACELEPGASVGTHVQEQYAEIVIVISGRAEAELAGRRCALEPGSVIELALGKTLAFDNCASAEPLRYLIVKA